MKVFIKHKFKNQCHDINELLSGCYKMSTFKSRLEKQSAVQPDCYDPYKYVGDGFELFVEGLIRLNENDGRIGIRDYQIIRGQDNGVDGYGIGLLGQKVAVQVKFRGNVQQVLTAEKDNLNSFVAEGLMNGGISQDFDRFGNQNFLVVTTAAGLHHYTDAEKFKGKVRCLGWDDLRTLVDNNTIFWDNLRESVYTSIRKVYNKS